MACAYVREETIKNAALTAANRIIESDMTLNLEPAAPFLAQRLRVSEMLRDCYWQVGMPRGSGSEQVLVVPSCVITIVAVAEPL